MERLTQEELEAIRKRAEAATEGPWKYNDKYGYLAPVIPQRMTSHICNEITRDYDADFIANARADIPKLLAEIESLNAEIADREASHIELYNNNKRLQTENTDMRIRCEVTDQSAEAVEADNERLREALMKIAQGDTWTAHPHDIAGWALGLKKTEDDAVDGVENAMHEHYTDMALEMEESE